VGGYLDFRSRNEWPATVEIPLDAFKAIGERARRSLIELLFEEERSARSS
jgi:hypothetical protein